MKINVIPYFPEKKKNLHSRQGKGNNTNTVDPRQTRILFLLGWMNYHHEKRKKKKELTINVIHDEKPKPNTTNK